VLGISAPALANDGRPRGGSTHLLVHLDGPAGPGAGFRVLVEDRPGGADGDPAYRWMQRLASDLIQVAAYRTAKVLGPGRLDMAVFDASAENGDTPVDFGAVLDDGLLPRAPRGRHPGGSHDGGLNADVGYYLTRLDGLVLEEDYAACTAHYERAEDDREKPKDAWMCRGPADRLDVDRQAHFFLALLDLHRGRFGGHLLEEVGVDRAVLDAVRARLTTWQRVGRFDVRAGHIADLMAIFTCDRWEGWQRSHHHHAHLRLRPLSVAGPWREPLAALEREARQARAALVATKRPGDIAVLDTQLLSYAMGRAVEVHVLPSWRWPARLHTVRYRMLGGPWRLPDDITDDYRYVFDVESGVQPGEGVVNVEAEITTADGRAAVVEAEVRLPRRDPRLFVGHEPGQIRGVAQLSDGVLRASLDYPPVLSALVTAVHYRVHSAKGAGVATHIVDAGWFQAPADGKAPRGGSRRSSADRTLPLEVPWDPALKIGLVEAKVILSGRQAVRVPLWVGGGAPEDALQP